MRGTGLGRWAFALLIFRVPCAVLDGCDAYPDQSLEVLALIGGIDGDQVRRLRVDQRRRRTAWRKNSCVQRKAQPRYLRWGC